MKRKDKKKKVLIINIIQILLIVVLVYSAIHIAIWYKNNESNKEIIKETLKTVKINDDTKTKQKYEVDFKELKNKNSDTIAWLKVENTNIEFPIVKANDNSYYLSHNFNKEYNKAGWIFADYKNKFDNTDKNIVIYGHNMRDGSMFGSMLNILDAQWYENEENTNITLYTENEKCIYKVFSIYKIENEDYYIKTEFKNDNEFEEFVKNLKKRSIKDFNVDISKDDNILTLSTCANNNKYRIVLHSVRVK